MNKKDGYTLITLLIYIAVFGILLGNVFFFLYRAKLQTIRIEYKDKALWIARGVINYLSCLNPEDLKNGSYKLNPSVKQLFTENEKNYFLIDYKITDYKNNPQLKKLIVTVKYFSPPSNWQKIKMQTLLFPSKI